MQEWTKSSLLTDLNLVKQKDAWMFPNLTRTSKLLVTLYLLKIYKQKPNRALIDIDDLGPVVWTYTCNYYMGRI